MTKVEELKGLVGTEIGVSEWFGIDQDRINAFADATLDHQWIHVDIEKAARGPFAGTIAHGFLTVSLLPYLTASTRRDLGDVRMGINYGLDRVRFITPVPVGSKIRARQRLVEAREVDGGVHLKIEVTVELEGSERPACVAETLTRLYF